VDKLYAADISRAQKGNLPVNISRRMLRPRLISLGTWTIIINLDEDLLLYGLVSSRVASVVWKKYW
jgi:hypothetical protein